MKKRLNHNQVHPNRKRVKKITLDYPQRCEGCGNTQEMKTMKHDCDGVPLCGACMYALIEEAKTWVCSGCGAKGPETVWCYDNWCEDCEHKTFN